MKLPKFLSITTIAIAGVVSFGIKVNAAPGIAAPRTIEPALREVQRGDFQDFFKEGRQQFERQVQEVQRRPAASEEILKIDPNLRQVDKELIQSLPSDRRTPGSRN
jgi:archaeosine-15-forming tRNA-guanine transglycosylase